MSRPTEFTLPIRCFLRRHVSLVWLPPRLALFAILLATLGCGQNSGPPRVAVSGKVLLDGKPLAEGMIRFIPEPGVTGPAAAARIDKGQFLLGRRDGPVVGRQRVEIEATNYQDFPIDDEQAFAAAFSRSPKTPLGENPVPSAYNKRSTLITDITPPGPQKLQFHLTSTPNPKN